MRPANVRPLVAALSIALLVAPPVRARAAVSAEANQKLDATAGAACSAAASGAAATRDTRTEGSAALYLLTHGGDPGVAGSLLEREFAVQNMDRSSPLYGAVVNPATPTDRNDTVFAAQAWAPILIRYHSGLSEQVMADLRARAVAAIAYLGTHPVSVSYTNIHLLTASELVTLGETLGDTNAVRRGTAGMTQWLSAVAKDGVHEFESPTYVTVDMDALYEGEMFSSRPESRVLFARALDYIWRETAANLFLPEMRIAGAQSRSYDPLRGSDEPLTLKLSYAGYSTSIVDPGTLRCLDVYSTLQNGSTYVFPADARAIAGMTPRVVEQRWDADPNATKYTYITSEYAIGSSNEDYDPTDRVASIDFAGEGPSLPSMRLMGDKTGYWFGPSPKVQRDGGRVWNHAATRPSVVQLRNAMLILTDMNANVPDEGAPLSVGVVFPTAGSIAIDGRPVDMTHVYSIGATPQSVVTVRVGSTVAAARIAFAEGANGPASFKIEATPDSAAKGVGRIAAIQTDHTPVPSPDLRAIVLLAADDGPGAATIGSRIRSARVEQSVEGPLWTVTATVDGHVLSATYDLRAHKSVRRTIDGASVAVNAPLSVNGSPISP